MPGMLTPEAAPEELLEPPLELEEPEPEPEVEPEPDGI